MPSYYLLWSDDLQFLTTKIAEYAQEIANDSNGRDVNASVSRAFAVALKTLLADAKTTPEGLL